MGIKVPPGRTDQAYQQHHRSQSGFRFYWGRAPRYCVTANDLQDAGFHPAAGWGAALLEIHADRKRANLRNAVVLFYANAVNRLRCK